MRLKWLRFRLSVHFYTRLPATLRTPAAHGFLSQGSTAPEVLRAREVVRADREGPAAGRGFLVLRVDKTEVFLRHPQIMVCQWANMLVPNERSAAARHPASAAAGLGGLLDGQPDFLAKRHLEGMAVGIADGSHIPDRRTSVSRAVEEPPFPTRQRAQPIHFLPTLVGHTKVSGRDERMVDL